jgi:hypothetical protein
LPTLLDVLDNIIALNRIDDAFQQWVLWTEYDKGRIGQSIDSPGEDIDLFPAIVKFCAGLEGQTCALPAADPVALE